MAFVLTASEAAALSALAANLEEAFKNGCEQPPGTPVVAALEGYAALESVGGRDVRPQAKAAFQSALAALLRSFSAASEAVHLIGGGGEPAFGSGWTNFGAPYHSCGWYVDVGGRAHLQGLATPSGASATGIIFTLPVAPSATERHVVDTSAGAGRVDVGSDGTVNLVTPATATGYISLDGLSFRVNP